MNITRKEHTHYRVGRYPHTRLSTWPCPQLLSVTPLALLNNWLTEEKMRNVHLCYVYGCLNCHRTAFFCLRPFLLLMILFSSAFMHTICRSARCSHCSNICCSCCRSDRFPSPKLVGYVSGGHEVLRLR
jgi:hypothetical protein